MNGWNSNMQYRYDVINYLIEQNNYKSYLEIGVRKPRDCFNKINADTKVAVDPKFITVPSAPNVTAFQVTSDAFFETWAEHNTGFDIIFIDGLHVYEQVDKDIVNSLNALNEGGCIILHDCNPAEEWHQRPAEQYTGSGIWNGTVWKGFVKHRSNPNLTMMTVDIDHGIGYIKKGSQEPLFIPESNMSWLNFDISRKKWLNLKTVKEFKNAIENA